MTQPELRSERKPDGSVLLTLGDGWNLENALPSADHVLSEVAAEKPTRLLFDCAGLTNWDSSLLVTVRKILAVCRENGISVDQSGLPDGVRKLLSLAEAEKQRQGAQREGARLTFLEWVGEKTLDQLHGVKEALAFIGGVTLSFPKVLLGRADFRRVDLMLTIQETGAQALPIITLISLLIGMILAFIAAIQLQLFGAQIFVANVVGIGVVRVMGAVMAGVIMAGRSGAAFAAQLGTMQVNEEIDALETLGLSPTEFLVLPRMVALTIMMPLLCLYADLMGVLGGMAIGVGMLDLGAVEYINQTQSALNMTHLWVGLFHSLVFGVIIALCGCLRGIQCERNASAVGYATTSAVVTALIWMVVATFVITLVCQVLGI